MRTEYDSEAAAPEDSGIFGLDVTPDAARVVLVPVPFDATASYGRAAAAGPAAILQASHQLDLWDADFGNPHEAGIVLLPEDSDVLAWNAQARAYVDRARRSPADRASAAGAANAIGAQLNTKVQAEVAAWLARGKVVGTIGGDHSAVFGAIAAHAERYPDMGILHIDAHADLRVAYEGFEWSHASIMHNVLRHTRVPRLVQVGIRDLSASEKRAIDTSGGRIVTFFDRDLARRQLQGEAFARVADDVITALPATVYISFDIDGLDPALCPGTGTPVPGGLSFREAVYLLARVTQAGKRVVGFDLTEVAPRTGHADDQWDANVGARVLYKLCGAALMGAGKAQ